MSLLGTLATHAKAVFAYGHALKRKFKKSEKSNFSTFYSNNYWAFIEQTYGITECLK